MPDELISQASPTGQVIPTGEQVQGQATEQVSPQAEPQTENKPLTRDEVQELIRSEATRIAQSQVAKGENRIQKVIQEKLAALNTSKDVLGLTDEQVQHAQQKIVTEAYTAPESQAETPTSVPQPAADVDRAIQYMNAKIDNVFAKVGTSVTSADPEFKDLQEAIRNAWNDPNGDVEILLAANRVASAKATRLKAQTENASARLVGGTGVHSSGNIPENGSGLSLLEKAYRSE
jgi:hypothetical protein